MRFSFGFPHNGSVSVPFHASTVDMLFHELSKGAGSNLGSYFEAGSCHVPFNRNKIAGRFVNETTDDYLVMVDTDVSFQHDILDRLGSLLRSGSEVHDRQTYPHIVAGRVDLGNGLPVFYQKVEDGVYSQDPEKFDGLKRFHAVGTGIIAISRYCLLKVSEESLSNQFFTHRSEAGKLMSDDFSFCALARDHGFACYGAWDVRGIHHKNVSIQADYEE